MIWLLVDATYLARRAWHTTGQLSHAGRGTGVAFGFLREMEKQTGLHLPDRIVLAFDSPGPGLREGVFPDYKINRRRRRKELADDPVTADQERDYYSQLNRLEQEILPAMGYRNIVSAAGYEADDIIAQAARDLDPNDWAVIVTSDEDMWQCLKCNVCWHNPMSGRTVTAVSFSEEWGINPDVWASVKAVAGCDTDDVPGIKGIGNKTAAKWFAGTLKPGLVSCHKISTGIETYTRNLPLVRLPFPGLVLPEFMPDDLTSQRHAAVFRELGFKQGRGRKREPEKVVDGFGLE